MDVQFFARHAAHIRQMAVPVNFLGTSPLNADFENAWYEATAAVSGETQLLLRLRVSLP